MCTFCSSIFLFINILSTEQRYSLSLTSNDWALRHVTEKFSRLHTANRLAQNVVYFNIWYDYAYVELCRNCSTWRESLWNWWSLHSFMLILKWPLRKFVNNLWFYQFKNEPSCILVVFLSRFQNAVNVIQKTAYSWIIYVNQRLVHRTIHSFQDNPIFIACYIYSRPILFNWNKFYHVNNQFLLMNYFFFLHPIFRLSWNSIYLCNNKCSCNAFDSSCM